MVSFIGQLKAELRDEKEKYLFGMVADYRPEDVYDEQMRELLDWGRTEKYLWTVTLPDDWQNA